MTTSFDTWGYGVIGGVTFNLPMLSAGTKIAFQGAYADGAIGYSARPRRRGPRDQGFNPNGNGLLFPMADGLFNPFTGSFDKSKAWSATAQLTWKLSPNFEIDPEVAYANVAYNSTDAAIWGVSPKATAWWVGAVFDWSPVKNLDFALDAIYESSHQRRRLAGPTRRRRLPEQRRRLQRPPAYRSLVLIERATRYESRPRSESSGVFFWAGFARAGCYIQSSERVRRLRTRSGDPPWSKSSEFICRRGQASRRAFPTVRCQTR